MKKGWEYKKLGEVADVIHGKNQKEVLSINGAYPIYGSGGNVMGYASDYLCEAGTTILGRKGSINNPLYITERFWNVDTAFGISAKEGYDGKFLYYFITTVDWLKKNTGTTLPSLTQQVVKSVIIPIPPLSEQQSIVDYLDSAFAKIDAMKANAEKALNEAKALFQASLKEMLEPKEGWEEKELQDICQIKGGKRLPKGYVLSSEPKPHRYITVADFTKNGTVVPSTVKYISDEVYKTIKRYTITSNDVYVTIVGSTVGKAGIIPPELDGANLTENACKLVLNNDYDKRFVYYLMCSEYVIKQEQLLTKVSAQPKLALNRLASIIVYVPSLSEQQSIATTLDSLKSKVDRLQANYEKISQECDALKQAILRQVFE